jgi:prepilin peptidase CpaA
MDYDWPSLLTTALTLIGAAVLLVASLHDIIARTVPNWTAVTLALLGLAQRAVAGGIAGGLLAGFVVFALAAFCWRRGWLGGGDVKLLGAASLIVSPGHVPAFICAVALAGGVLALVYVIASRIVAARAPQSPVHARFPTMGMFRRAIRIERWRIRRGGPLPYACAIAAGFVVVVL